MKVDMMVDEMGGKMVVGLVMNLDLLMAALMV